MHKKDCFDYFKKEEKMLSDKEIEKIVIEQDAKAISELSQEDMEDLISELVYEDYFKRDYQSLNEEQKTVLLVMALEDCLLANGIETLLEDEDLNCHVTDLAEALLYIGAGKTAMEIRKLNELIKKKNRKGFEAMTYQEWQSWLEENLAAQTEAEKISSRLAERPDGEMTEVIYKFVRSDKEIAKKLLQR